MLRILPAAMLALASCSLRNFASAPIAPIAPMPPIASKRGQYTKQPRIAKRYSMRSSPYR